MKFMFHHIVDLNIMIREEQAARDIRKALKDNPKNNREKLEEIMKKLQKESMDRKKIRQICANSYRKDRLTIEKILAHVEK